MKGLLKNLGIILMVLGAGALIATQFVDGLANSNVLLGCSMVAIVLGLIAYIILNKRITD